MDKCKEFTQGIAGGKSEYDLRQLEGELGESLLYFMRQNGITHGMVTVQGPMIVENPRFGTSAKMTVWLQYSQE